MRLIIPDVPPSLNKLLRMHWAEKQKLAKNWAWLIRGALPGRFLEPFVKMRCKVTLCHSRFYDKDNAYGASKVVIDSLKGFNAIRDDSPMYLDLTVEQEKCPHKQRRTIIELEAVGGPHG